MTAVVVAVAFSASPASASTAWQIQTTANPSTSSGFAGVSCPSTTACAAVGSYLNSSHARLALAERWNGTSWATRSVPGPSGSTANALAAVSCSSATACTAVGFYVSSISQTVTLAERWNGTTWSAQSTPNPTHTFDSELTGVSCPSATLCTAVGSWEDSSSNRSTLAERWDGTSWTIQTTPSPIGNAELDAVACPSTTACTAVGLVSDSSQVDATLAERWINNTWVVQATPSPTGSSLLAAVSCPSSSLCTAVGQTAASSLAERWNGSKWTIQPTPAFTHGAALTGVSCPSTTACTAAGHYNKNSNVEDTLAEHWNGTKWSVQATPNKMVLTNVFDGVSCPSTTTCTAVGNYEPSGEALTLAERR